MKPRLASLALIFALTLGGTLSADAAISQGGGGTSTGSFECYSCYFQGGWTPGMKVWATCISDVNGAGNDCYVQNNQCHYASGCISLPDDVAAGMVRGIIL